MILNGVEGCSITYFQLLCWRLRSSFQGQVMVYMLTGNLCFYIGLISTVTQHRTWFQCHHSTNYNHPNTAVTWVFHHQTWHSIYETGPRSAEHCFRWHNPTVTVAPLKTKSQGWDAWSIRAWGRAFHELTETLCSVAIWNYGAIAFVVNHSRIRRGAQTSQKRPRTHSNVNTAWTTTRFGVWRKMRYPHFTGFLLAFTVCILTFPLPVEQLTDLLILCNSRHLCVVSLL